MKKIILALIMLSFSCAFGTEKEASKNIESQVKILIEQSQKTKDFIKNIIHDANLKEDIQIKSIKEDVFIFNAYAKKNEICIAAEFVTILNKALSEKNYTYTLKMNGKELILDSEDIKNIFRQIILHETKHIISKDSIKALKVNLIKNLISAPFLFYDIFTTINDMLHQERPKKTIYFPNEWDPKRKLQYITKEKEFSSFLFFLVRTSSKLICKKIANSMTKEREIKADAFAFKKAKNITELKSIQKLYKFVSINAPCDDPSHPSDKERVQKIEEEIQNDKN